MKKRLDYRRELEAAAHQMILIHDVDVIAKLILRTIVKNIKVKHAGIFLYNRKRREYVAKVSRGQKGFKIPSGFAKISPTNPIIRYFLEKDKRIGAQGFLIYDKLLAYQRANKSKRGRRLKKFYEELKFQMNLFQAHACVAGFFRDKLTGVLFLGQKFDKERFFIEELGFLSVLASDVVMAIQNAWLFEDLKIHSDRNKNLFLNTVRALAGAIEAKDKYTSGHTERVTFYSLVLFDEIRKIKKIPPKEWDDLKEKLRVAALLHDIGKIGIPEKVLNKNGLLNDVERAQIQKHPIVGFEIIKPIEEFKEILEGVRHHHERFDGKGYPEGLSGKRIPLLAAVICVADAYDAMTTHRPYRAALNHKDAFEEILKENRKQFHPLVVKSFIRAYKKGKL